MNVKTIIYGNGKSITQKGFFWNMIASGLISAMSFILLVAVNFTLGADNAGVFTLAFSIGQWMLTIGYFDMRSYQVTDLKEQTPFKHYFTFRAITCTAMILISIGYVLIFGRNNSSNKNILILLMCVLKMLDAVEDVMGGLYQKNGRLDIAGRVQSIRVLATMISFIGVLFVSKNLIIASIVSIAIGIFFIILLNAPVVPKYERLVIQFEFKFLKTIFWGCLPLFIGSYLMSYIGMVPKTAINTYGTDTQQTIFGFLYMPSYVISLLSNFIYQPLLVPMAKSWEDANYKVFSNMVKKLLLLLAGLTIVVLAGGYLLGIPILSVVSNEHLAPYKNELLILLFGGGVGAIGTAIYYCVTVIRKQKYLLIGHVTSAVAAFFLAPMLVEKYGILGGAIAYTVPVTIRTLLFSVIFLICYRSEKEIRLKKR